MRERNWRQAADAFSAVVEAGDAEPAVHVNLGLALQRLGRHEQALESFQAALELDPELEAARAAMPQSLIEVERTEEALEILRNAAAANPRDAGLLHQLASLHEMRGDTPAMLDQFLALRDLTPRDPEHHYRLGKAFGRLAAWCTQRLEATAPSSPQLLQLRGEALLLEGRLEEAEAELRAALEAGPMPGTNWALAQVYLRLEQPDQALAAVERELELVPDHALAQRLLQQIRAKTAR